MWPSPRGPQPGSNKESLCPALGFLVLTPPTCPASPDTDPFIPDTRRGAGAWAMLTAISGTSVVQWVVETRFHLPVVASPSPEGFMKSATSSSIFSRSRRSGIGPPGRYRCRSKEAAGSHLSPLRHRLKGHQGGGSCAGEAVASPPSFPSQGLHSLRHVASRQNPSISSCYCWRAWDWGFESARCFEPWILDRPG